MRKALKDLINQTIVFQYSLPRKDPEIGKTHHTHEEDHCYKTNESKDIIPIIYNGIIDYSYNESEIDLTKLDALQIRALKTKLRYNEDAVESSKIKYGFFGETLLFSILQVIYGAETLISRGNFYNLLEKSETKGYDTYQLIEKSDGNIELWFGEVKFFGCYKAALVKIFENIDKAISDEYFNNNVIAMCDRGQFNKPDSIVEQIINAWKENPSIVIADEIKKYNLTFIYPILVAFDSKQKDYDDLIKDTVEHINSTYPRQNFSMTIPYKIFFIFLPIENVTDIKKEIIQWIESRQPQIL